MSLGFAVPARSRRKSSAARREPTFSATAAAMNWLSGTPSVAADSAAVSALTRQPNSFHLHDAELLPFGNNEFEPDDACQSLLARIEREEAFEFELKRTGDVQNIERSATDRGCVLTT